MKMARNAKEADKVDVTQEIKRAPNTDERQNQPGEYDPLHDRPKTISPRRAPPEQCMAGDDHIDNGADADDDLLSDMDAPLLERPERLTLHLIIGLFAALFGGSFQYGYNVGVMDSAAAVIKDAFFPFDSGNTDCPEYSKLANDTNYNGNDECIKKLVNHHILQDDAYAIVISVFALSAAVITFTYKSFSQTFGTLGTLVTANIFSFLGALSFEISSITKSYFALIIGRLLLGAFGGLMLGATPSYVIDISPKRLRLSFMRMHDILIAVGIFFAQILSMRSYLGTEKLWPMLLALTAIPSVVSLLSYYFMPFSPLNLMDCQDEAGAQITLVQLRGTTNVSQEMNELRWFSRARASTRNLLLGHFIREKCHRRQLWITTVVMMGQQFTSVFVLFYYGHLLFPLAGLVDKQAQESCLLILGGTYLCGTMLAGNFVDRMNRKTLLVFGFTMMASCSVIASIIILLYKDYGASEWSPYIFMSALIGYTIAYSLGPGPVSWVLLWELYPITARSAAVMYGSLTYWFSQFIITVSVPALIDVTEGCIFIFLMIITLATSLYVLVCFQETFQLPLLQVYNKYASVNGVNKIQFKPQRQMRQISPENEQRDECQQPQTDEHQV